MPTATAYSSLMLDHAQGIPAGQFSTKLETLRSPLEQPILVGLQPGGGLRVLLPSTDNGATEWQAPIDIASQWDGAVPASVKDFAVYQDAQTLQTTVALLVHASPDGSSSAADLLFVAEGFAPCDRSAWTHLRRGGQTVATFAAKAAVSRADRVAVVPVAQAARPAWDCGVVVAGQRADGTLAISLYAKNALSGEWRGRDQAVPGGKPMAATSWSALAAGVLPSGAAQTAAGFFCLAGNDLRFATLTSDGLDYQDKGVLALASSARIDSIATATSDASGVASALYAGGNGIYRWDGAAIGRGDAPQQLLKLDAAASSAATRIVACAQQGSAQANATLAFLSSAGDLYFGRDVFADATAGETPVAIASDVSTMACIVEMPNVENPATSRQIMALSYADGHTCLMERDTAPSASDEPWDVRVALTAPPAASAAVAATAAPPPTIEQRAYCTRIVVSGDPARPEPFARATLSASVTCGAIINGTYVRMPKGIPIPVEAGPDGAISLTVPTTTLDAPTFTLVRQPQASAAAASESTVIDPAASTLHKLQSLSSAADLAKAKDCHGQPVFDKAPDNAQAALDFLKEFFAQKQRAAKRRSGAAAVDDGARHICLRRTAKGTRLLVDREAQDAFASFEYGTVLNLGTLLLMMLATRRLRDTLIGLRTGSNGLTYLVLDIGVKTLYSAEWHFGERATSVALDWLLEQFLQLPAEKIIGWLGWTFDWKQVGRLHGAVRRLADLTTAFAIDNVTTVVDKIDVALDALQGNINYIANLSAATKANPFLKQNIGDLLPINGTRLPPPPSIQLPPLHYIFEKTVFGATSDMFATDKIPAADYGVFDAPLTALEVPMSQLAANLQAALGSAAIETMSLGEVLQLAVQVGISDQRAALKSAFTQLLQAMRTLFVDAQNQMSATVQVPVLNAIWRQQLGQSAPLQVMDLFCLAGACGTSFLSDAMGFATLTDAQIDTINDPKYKKLEQVLAALTTNGKKRGKSAGRRVGTLPVHAFSAGGLGGLFQVLSAISSMFSTAANLFKGYFDATTQRPAGSYLAALAGPWDPTEGKYQFHRLNRLVAYAEFAAYGFCLLFFALTYATSWVGKTWWYILYGIWYIPGAAYYVMKNYWQVWADTTGTKTPPLLRQPWVDFAIGLLCLGLVAPATMLMTYEPQVAVEYRSGMWQVDTGLTGVLNCAVALLLILSPFPNPKAKILGRVLSASIPITFLIKGVYEIYMSQVYSYAHASVLNAKPNNAAGASFAVFPVEADGPTPTHGADITDISAPLSPLSGIAAVQVQSGAFSPALSPAVLVPTKDRLIGIGRTPGRDRDVSAGGYVQRSTGVTGGMQPGRATTGARGLYVIDTAQKAVLLFSLPIDLDKVETSSTVVVSGLTNPAAVATIVPPTPAGAEPDEMVYIADGAAIKAFHQSGAAATTLSGPKTLLQSPISLAIAPDARLLIVADRVSGILTFNLDASGDVAPKTQWTFTKSTIADLAIDSKGNVVYADGDSVHVMPINTAPGADPKPKSTIKSSDTPLLPRAIAMSA